MKVIVFTRPDGGTSIAVPIINTHGADFKPARETVAEDEALARLMAKLPSDAINPRVVDKKEIPRDRTFRNALKADLTFDMERARAIHRDRIRVARKPKLEALDVLWMKALASGDTVGASNVEAKRQALRDAPQFPAIDLATTPDQLKAAIPPILVD